MDLQASQSLYVLVVISTWTRLILLYITFRIMMVIPCTENHHAPTILNLSLDMSSCQQTCIYFICQRTWLSPIGFGRQMLQRLPRTLSDLVIALDYSFFEIFKLGVTSSSRTKWVVLYDPVSQLTLCTKNIVVKPALSTTSQAFQFL